MKKPPDNLWALFDNAGEFCGTYLTDEEADHDAVGPRFRPKYRVVRYDRSTNHTIKKWSITKEEP